jgi:uncharacterized protein YjbI with pentapeptide repeats
MQRIAWPEATGVVMTRPGPAGALLYLQARPSGAAWASFSPPTIGAPIREHEMEIEIELSSLIVELLPELYEIDCVKALAAGKNPPDPDEYKKLADDLGIDVKINSGSAQCDLQAAISRHSSLIEEAIEANFNATRDHTAILQSAKSANTILTNAQLFRADASALDLTDLNFEGANLSFSRLDQSSFRGANLSYADLTKISLRKADLGTAILHRANLTMAWLNEADLSQVSCNQTNFTEARLFKAMMRRSNMIEANLTRACLCEATATGSDFSKAVLDGSDLRKTKMDRCIFQAASLTGVNLGNANISFTDLAGANLSGANLRSANMRNSCLLGANLSSAYMRGADLNEADLGNIKWSKKTIWPGRSKIKFAKNMPISLRECLRLDD